MTEEITQPLLARIARENAAMIEAGLQAEEEATRQRRAPLLPIPERNTRAEAARALLLVVVAWVVTARSARSQHSAQHIYQRKRPCSYSPLARRTAKPP